MNPRRCGDHPQRCSSHGSFRLNLLPFHSSLLVHDLSRCHGKKKFAEKFLMEVSIRLSYPLDSQSVLSLFATRKTIPLNISYTCHVSVHPECAPRLQGLFLIDQYDAYKRATFKVSEHESKATRELNDRVRVLQERRVGHLWRSQLARRRAWVLTPLSWQDNDGPSRHAALYHTRAAREARHGTHDCRAAVSPQHCSECAWQRDSPPAKPGLECGTLLKVKLAVSCD